MHITSRERQVLQLLADGLQQDAVGDRLGVSYQTIKNHLQNARVRLRAETTSQLIAIACFNNLINRDEALHPDIWVSSVKSKVKKEEAEWQCVKLKIRATLRLIGELLRVEGQDT